MTIVLWFLYLFLVIFALAALVALAGLTGIVKVKEPYMNWLVKLLILQVVATVIAFATKSIDTVMYQHAMTKEKLTEAPWPWKWVSPVDAASRQHWVTMAEFRYDKGKVRFVADTHHGSEKGPTILTWRGTSSFALPANPFEPIEFEAERQATAEGATLDPGVAHLLGKPERVTVLLKPSLSLRGRWSPGGSATGGGISFERAWEN